MKKLLLILLLGFSMFSIFAQEPQEITDTFFKTYKDKGSEAAIDCITSTNLSLQKNIELTGRWKTRLTNIDKNNKPYCGYEILDTTKTGNSIVQIECMLKYESAPFIINMTFYKPETKWQLNNLQIQQFRQGNRRQQLQRRQQTK